ncbi:MAG TPA: PLP-dependent aminotransferase family protein [Dongiaceae bacterium]|nr:PLP-dependent aminotransferase family protein [Dongiaceae bacterium]
MGHASQAYLFHLDGDASTTLQARLRRRLVSAILDGQIPAGRPLPSCRSLARSLKIARNTVVLTYQDLVEEGYLISRERSGFFVNPDILRNRAGSGGKAKPIAEPAAAAQIDWQSRLLSHPSQQRSVVKPQNWADQPYPFIYGQVDQNIFPLSAWRECSRQALSIDSVKDWSKDRFTEDDPVLVEQIRTRLLPRRGVMAAADEILVTVGAQNALYLLAQLLFNAETRFGIEDPGYTDARNIASLRTSRITGLDVDEQGLVMDRQLAECDYVYVTPSHQFPTTVTMSLARRHALLAAAQRDDFIVIEDDYESELAHTGTPQPALKSLDSRDRVIFLASLSKTLAPGLRLGYMVGPRAFIREARALRRLMLRHPAANNQRTVALFLADGHYDGLLRRLSHAYRDRLLETQAALARYLPEFTADIASGGSALWIKGPAGLDMQAVEAAALQRGVVIEAGAVHFLRPAIRGKDRSSYFRLGVSSIPIDRIEPGIRILAEVIGASTAATPGAKPKR